MDMHKQIAEFFAKNKEADDVKIDGHLIMRDLWRECRCGCHGDYTEHSMRSGESGRYSSEIVR